MRTLSCLPCLPTDERNHRIRGWPRFYLCKTGLGHLWRQFLEIMPQHVAEQDGYLAALGKVGRSSQIHDQHPTTWLQDAAYLNQSLAPLVVGHMKDHKAAQDHIELVVVKRDTPYLPYLRYEASSPLSIINRAKESRTVASGFERCAQAMQIRKEPSVKEVKARVPSDVEGTPC